MTPDEALAVIADEVVRSALEEVMDNGLWDSYLDAELAERSSNAIRARLLERVASRPDPARLSDALRAHVRIGRE